MTLSNWLLNDVQEDTTDDVNNTNDAIETTFEINVPVAKEDSFSSSTCSLYKSAKNFNQKKELHGAYLLRTIEKPRRYSKYFQTTFFLSENILFSPMHQHPFFVKKMYTIWMATISQCGN